MSYLKNEKYNTINYTNEEINELKKKLNNANEIISKQNLRIKELEDKLKLANNSSNNNDKILIQNLKNEINKKDEEINALKLKLQNINIKNTKLVSENEMTCVYFTSMDQKIHYPIPCLNSNVFAEIEEKLYLEYPEYRETNNYFIFNGNQILRFKTIKDNKIINGKPVILVVPSNEDK